LGQGDWGDVLLLIPSSNSATFSTVGVRVLGVGVLRVGELRGFMGAIRDKALDCCHLGMPFDLGSFKSL
jgi:hypothetical protein